MPERKSWSEKEDQILRILKQQRGLKKWSQIAKVMNEQYGIKDRTGKQCRQRYHNHLDSSIVVAQWSKEQEQILLIMHGQVGNKWSVIAHKLPGRSDNCVKNHFYSKLRKSTRKLNRLIHEKYRRDYREIKIPLLNRLIQTTEERFKISSQFEQEAIAQCMDLINKLFKLEQLILVQEKESNELTERALIQDFMKFELILKNTNRSQKQHKASIQTNYSDKRQDQPFYEMFRRVCQQILLDKP